MQEDNPGEGTSSGYKFRSISSQRRDRIEILEAANYDEDALFATTNNVVKAKNKDAGHVVKRVLEDPSLGEPLAKYLKKLERDLEIMNDNLSRDEEGASIVECLAYLLGFQYLPC